MEFFQEVFLLVESGPIGIDLQSVRGERGAFVESFYRGDAGQILDAERSGELCVGDRIAVVADCEVLYDCIEDIRAKLQCSHRPFQITFRKIDRVLLLDDVIVDPRVKVWIHSYMEDYCSSLDSLALREVIEVYNLSKILCDYFKDNAAWCSGWNDDGLHKLYMECLEFCRSRDLNSIEFIGNEHALICFLETYLTRTLLFKFQQCSVAKKLVGWMSNSPAFYAYPISEILTQNELTVSYYLHLCTLGKNTQRFVHAILNKRYRSRWSSGTSDSKRIREVEQRIVLQAVQEGLLHSFYESEIFEHILWQREKLSDPTCASSVLCRINTVDLPVGISLHRRKNFCNLSLPSFSPPADIEPGYVLLFDTSASSGDIQVGVSATLVLESGHLQVARAASSAVLAAPVVGFLAPGGIRYASAAHAPPPKLVSFVLTMKDGTFLYGASLILHRLILVEDKCFPSESGEYLSFDGGILHEQQREDGRDSTHLGSTLPPTCLTPGVEPVFAAEHEPESEQGLKSEPISIAAEAEATIEEPITPYMVEGSSSIFSKNSTSQESLLSLVLAKSQESALQTSAVIGKVRDGAGVIFRGIKQWSEHAVPAAMHMPSLLAQSAAAAPSSYLSPPAPPPRVSISSSHDRYSYSVQHEPSMLATLNCRSEATEARTHQLLPYGISILTTEPKVECLRALLRLAAPCIALRVVSEDAVADPLVSILHTWSAASDLMDDLQAPALQQGVATDFNACTVFDTLCPRNLVTILLASLLEYRILIVAKEHSAVLLLGEWLKLAMHPLKWFHIYAPVVPQHLALELLQCPAPYLLGILRESLDTALTPLPAGVLLVDLDCGIVTAVPADLQAALSAAESLIDQLAVVLKPNLSSCDDLKPNGGMPDLSNPLAPDGPAELCRRFVRTLLQPVEKSFVVLDDSSEEMVVALDEDLFVRKVCAADNGSNQEHNVNVGALEMLARQLMRSQSFSEHLLTLAREFKDAHGSNM